MHLYWVLLTQKNIMPLLAMQTLKCRISFDVYLDRQCISTVAFIEILHAWKYFDRGSVPGVFVMLLTLNLDRKLVARRQFELHGHVINHRHISIGY